ncbi:TNT domain-containing protein [Xanthomonas axonopodis pv. poinsettiicola]|uniref:TNT domain-containing protein n=2 Tax=Xanthomonas axonopodis TaxID=53413 RepID=UPI003556C0E3
MASVAIGTGLSMLGNASDSSSSTTKSDIAAGSIQIRNGDASALAGLDRSATELQQSGLKEIFDQKKIEDQKELMGLAGAIGFRAAGDIASSMQQRALSEYATAYSTNNPQGMADAQAKMDSWADGGLNKTLLHGLTGAAVAALGGGDVAGGALAAAGAEKAKLAMAGYLRDQGIASDSETYRALMELGSAAIGGALGGVAGANTALAGDQFNRQLHPDEVKWIKDNAAVFAYEQGISEESAKQILLIEAASYVDSTIQSALKDTPMNEAAVKFLGTNNNEYDGVKAFDTSDRDNFHLYGKKLAGTPENFKEVFDALGAAGLKEDELQLMYQPELLTYAGKGIGRDGRLTVAVPAAGAAIGVAAVGGGACALNLVACGRLVVGALDAIATEATGGHSLLVSTAWGSAVVAKKLDNIVKSVEETTEQVALAVRRVTSQKTGSAGTTPVHGGTVDGEAGGFSRYDEFRKSGEEVKPDGNWNWPSNLGFAEAHVDDVLPVGTRLDRYGSPDGAFLSPFGTPYEQRALAPGSRGNGYHEYEVIKPLPIIRGEIAPAFGQPGGGTQILPRFKDRVNVDWLRLNGFLKEVDKSE